MNELMAPETVSFLERAVRDPTIDVDKLAQLIALQERVERRQAEIRYSNAMNDLQREMPAVTRDKINPMLRARYVTYEAIDRVIRPYYTKHGFSVSFRTAMNGTRVSVTCVVRGFGHEETNTLESNPDLSGSRGQANKTEVQGIGSIVTYLKRYTMMAAFAIALENDDTDDDGERGSGSYNRRPPPPPRPTPAQEAAPPAAPDNTEARLARLQELLSECPDTDAVEALRQRSKTVIDSAPPEIQARINSMFAATIATLAAGDPVLVGLLAEVDLMSLDEIEELPRSMAWQRKTRDVFPPDMDQLNEHIELRRQQLKGPSDNG